MKRFIGSVLVLMLLLCCFAAHADYKPGDLITVTFTMSSGGAATAGVSVDYDASVLTYVSAEVTGVGFAGARRFAAISLAGGSFGTVTATYTFQINEDAQPGSYSVTASVLEAYDAAGNATGGVSVSGDQTIVVSGECQHVSTNPVKDGKASTCTEAGRTAGKKCSDCGIVIEQAQIIPAKGHDFQGEWFVGENDDHVRACARGCGKSMVAACEYFTAVIDDAELKICPICGRCGDVVIERNTEAEIMNPDADNGDAFIARVALNPVVDKTECVAVITAVYERNGQAINLEEDADPVMVKLPLVPEVSCQLVHVTVDEMTQELVWHPVEYTIENECMVFMTNQLGLFLLMAE